MGYRRIIDCDQLFEDDNLFEAIGSDGVLLYIRMWSLAECWGGIEDNPRSIARQSGALNLSAKKTEKILKKLIQMEKIFPYELEGKKYLWLKNLHKFQKRAKVPESKLPLPRWIEANSTSYESRTFWNYTILEHLAPSNQNFGRTSKEFTPTDTNQIITKQNKDKDRGRQTIPEQDKAMAKQAA
jgi:hypothetical protein